MGFGCSQTFFHKIIFSFISFHLSSFSLDLFHLPSSLLFSLHLLLSFIFSLSSHVYSRQSSSLFLSLDLLFSSLSSSLHFFFLLSLSLSLSLSPCVVVVVVVSCVCVFVVVVCACGVVWCGTLKTPVFQNAPVCTGTTPASVTLAVVMPVHTGTFRMYTREAFCTYTWWEEWGWKWRLTWHTNTNTNTHNNTHTLHSNNTHNAQSTTQITQSVVASSACQNLPTWDYHLTLEIHKKNPWILHIFNNSIVRQLVLVNANGWSSCIRVALYQRTIQPDLSFS